MRSSHGVEVAIAESFDSLPHASSLTTHRPAIICTAGATLGGRFRCCDDVCNARAFEAVCVLFGKAPPQQVLSAQLAPCLIICLVMCGLFG